MTPSRRTSMVRNLHPAVFELLEPLLDVSEEAAGVCSVDQAMVVTHAQVTHWPDGDRIIYDDGPLLDGSDPEDGHLRLVDERQPVERTEDPGIGDGERASLHLVRA